MRLTLPELVPTGTCHEVAFASCVIVSHRTLHFHARKVIARAARGQMQLAKCVVVVDRLCGCARLRRGLAVFNNVDWKRNVVAAKGPIWMLSIILHHLCGAAR